ncbi:MAG: heavy metal-binding domain-containing protein [Planctomycetales bacterium]|nr:heavy metal-binding domain-containing protein [Planctomycetales bacterium]
MGEFVFQIGFVVLMIGLGFVAGSIAESRHLAQLAERERRNGPFLVTQLKSFPAYSRTDLAPQMIVGEVVIASDYFKTFLASMRRIFGGEVRSFHSLMSRARREATQRIVEQARELGYNAICNLRIETADVGGSTSSKKGAAMVAVIASATAYTFRSPSA